MLNYEEAQELHLLVGGPIELWRDGAVVPSTGPYVKVPLKDLERARELAAILVSDTDPDEDDDDEPDATDEPDSMNPGSKVKFTGRYHSWIPWGTTVELKHYSGRDAVVQFNGCTSEVPPWDIQPLDEPQ
jgi:hypothetical protein